ncbi:hypothetical protein DO97_00840 [Neosynechococcus sphagnicola sy1]|uniref:Uncharacterized protein n=1 Tax=Neosynechococcus sphagnicola sy1 TaxID=1497020 RepID=A0A098THA6_9CYAN|nr:hypothetical protein [Neosynechococcus sphagnicola]KGF71357.1 hypothetical protein DO97_00840 [Neosynechococcus sphagnicola sy1]
MWAEDFFEFAFIPNLDAGLEDLAGEAEPENWAYQIRLAIALCQFFTTTFGTPIEKLLKKGKLFCPRMVNIVVLIRGLLLQVKKLFMRRSRSIVKQMCSLGFSRIGFVGDAGS